MKGTLFCTTATDALGQIIPLAFGITASGEDRPSWLWFCRHLREVLEPYSNGIFERQHALTIMSDRDKGLVGAVAVVFPLSAHGWCLQHLSANFQEKWKHKELTKQVWALARAATKDQADVIKANIAAINPDVAAWLEQAGYANFVEAEFEGQRYGHLTSNISESVNAWLNAERNQPVEHMIESLRAKLAAWFEQRREFGATKMNGVVVPPLVPKLQESLQKGCRLAVLHIEDRTYEVKLRNQVFDTVIVDLNRRICQCKQWQANGFPCPHAAAAILRNSESIESYVERFLTCDAYKSTYAGIIRPPRSPEEFQWAALEDPYLTDEELGGRILASSDSESDVEWHDIVATALAQQMPLQPPRTRRQAGRPHSRRLRSRGDPTARPLRCTRCKENGHNRRTCKAPLRE